MYKVTDSQAAELRKHEGHLDYSDELFDHLSGVSIVGLTGPSAVGVTTLIKVSGMYKVPGATSRNPRYEGEDEIRFVPHTKATIDECIDKAKSGNLAQVKLSPEGFVYFSEAQDYKPGQPNAVDMHARSIIALGQLPIKELIPIVIVAPFDEWATRFETERGAFADHPDRLWNDLDSLMFTDDYYDKDLELAFTPISNPIDKLNSTANLIKEIVNGNNDVHTHIGDAMEQRDEMIREMSLLV